jgi:hypothetical protein
VDDLAEILTDPDVGGFLPGNVNVYVDPAHDQLRREIARRCREADDVLLVYFAGHGLIDSDGDLLLATADTEDDLCDVTAVEVKRVRRAIAESPAAIRILILDCCYSGRALDSFMSGPQSGLLGQVEIEGNYTLTSAPRNTRSVFVPGERHTVFSGELIAVLRDGVADDKSLLSLGIVHRQLVSRLRQGDRPKPKVLHSDSASDLALVRNMGYRASVREPRPAPPREVRSLADADDLVKAAHATASQATAVVPLRAAALDTTWPILARRRFCCVLIQIGFADVANAALAELGKSGNPDRHRQIETLLHSLETDGRLARYAGDRWNLDGLVPPATPEAAIQPTAVWGTAMAMLLDAADLQIPLRTKAIAELAQLGYPHEATAIARGMLRDSQLDPITRRTVQELFGA